jgi:biopolymer transport protein ExbD
MRKTSTLLLMIAICFISSITFAQNSNKVNGKAYFKLPSKATTEDYEHNTVIVKIKKEHKSLCEENSVNIPELNAYLSSI